MLAVIVQVIACERPGCKAEGATRTVSLALWGSPDRALRLCESCFAQWQIAYSRLLEQLETPGQAVAVKIVAWDVWLEGFSRESHEGERG